MDTTTQYSTICVAFMIRFLFIFTGASWSELVLFVEVLGALMPLFSDIVWGEWGKDQTGKTQRRTFSSNREGGDLTTSSGWLRSAKAVKDRRTWGWWWKVLWKHCRKGRTVGRWMVTGEYFSGSVKFESSLTQPTPEKQCGWMMQLKQNTS